MKTIKAINSIFIFVFLGLIVIAAKPVTGQNAGSFTQSDREILVRLEEKFESLQKQQELTNQRIDDLKSDVNSKLDGQKSEFDRKFDEMRTFMYWGFGILFSMMMVLMGFVLWNRRTAITPIEKRTRRIEEAMIEYAKTDPAL